MKQFKIIIINFTNIFIRIIKKNIIKLQIVLLNCTIKL